MMSINANRATRPPVPDHGISVEAGLEWPGMAGIGRKTSNFPADQPELPTPVTPTQSLPPTRSGSEGEMLRTITNEHSEKDPQLTTSSEGGGTIKRPWVKTLGEYRKAPNGRIWQKMADISYPCHCHYPSASPPRPLCPRPAPSRHRLAQGQCPGTNHRYFFNWQIMVTKAYNPQRPAHSGRAVGGSWKTGPCTRPWMRVRAS